MTESEEIRNNNGSVVTTDIEVRCCNTDALRDQLESTIKEWAIRDNWPAGYDSIKFSTLIDPEANFVGLLNKEIVSMVSAVNYGDQLSFIGTFLTADGHKGKGYGTQLFRECLQHAGDRVTGLYSNQRMTEWYKRHGFVQTGTCSIFRKPYTGKVDLPADFPVACIIPAKDLDFADLCRFDRSYFPADRPEFLRAWLSHPKVILAPAFVKDGVIHGYGVLRQCIGDTICKFGPLFADSFVVAEQLALAMLNAVPEGTEIVQFDCLDDNPQTDRLAEKVGFSPTGELHGGRVLWKNGRPEFDVSGVYAYTSGAFG
ncbi:uncharacterized protein LOC129592302 [Paramacrobiotus metropolitanus]|uniref:uncharacterized protein LOC129592302 n=1 Tax=Paramacrobiotus metropolitanus TaxID=2943436 RepID=UPI0024464712|nr:uncharacterized protein LOC129592302 [Paramacrobiotus metropolitanus]